jgi:transposase
MYNFVTPEREQLFLMAPDAREWLPARHLAWGLLEQAAGMDVSPFLAWHRADGQGRPAYHPAMMVTLVMYCYCKGIRSSRAIEMATFDDVGARVICGNLHPDHSTVARFVSRHEGPVKGLLVASLVACAREGLVSVDVVAGDGTKVKASASMDANATAAQLDLDIAGLEALLAAEVSTWMAQARAQDAAEDASFSGGDDAPGGPRPGGRPGAPKRTAGKLLRRQQARARLAADAAARQEAADAARAAKIGRLERRVAARRASADGEEAAAAARVARYQRRAAAKAAAGRSGRVAGTVPATAGGLPPVRSTRQRAETAQRDLAAALAAPAAAADPARPPRANTTYPASRVMPGKQAGGFLQGYNPQVIAAARQVIISIGIHDSPNDVAALHPALKLARANLDAAGISDPIARALFDAGYASEGNFTTATETELYVAVTRESRQTGRRRDGRKQATAYPGWQAMTARLDTPEGKTLYKRRSAMIEPVFAQLFNRLGRQLNYRGTRTSLELHLWAASHNLLKAIRASNRRHARPPAPIPAPAS